VERGLVAYEFKWNPSQAARARSPKAFSEAYPDAAWTPVSRDNYVEFVTGLIWHSLHEIAAERRHFAQGEHRICGRLAVLVEWAP